MIAYVTVGADNIALFSSSPDEPGCEGNPGHPQFVVHPLASCIRSGAQFGVDVMNSGNAQRAGSAQILYGAPPKAALPVFGGAL